jgi:DNA-binding CsgD family transcriptional regulator
MGTTLDVASAVLRLRITDAQAVFRLLGEVRELGNDPAAWKPHMLRGLTRLVRGVVAGTGECLRSRRPDQLPFCGFADVGFASDAIRRTYYQYAYGEDFSNDPAMPAWLAVMRRDDPWTARRQDFTPDRVWYASDHAQRVLRPAGVEQYMTSGYPVAALDVVHMITISRPWGERRFVGRELAILHLFHTELGRLWDEIPAPADDVLAKLPPRLRQTLEALASGDGEKQIAARYGLSRHTVHNHIRELYRRADCGTRGALLSRMLPKRLPFRPRLVSQGPPAGANGNGNGNGNGAHS